MRFPVWLKSKIKISLQTLIQIVVFVILSIIILSIILSVLPDKTSAALQGISYILFIICIETGFLFIQKFRQNKEREKTQIYLKSSQLIPMLKYISSGKDGDMKTTNSEYAFFYSCTYIFLVWTLIAGALLTDEYRYIGLMLSALDVVIIYLYTYSQLNEARNISLTYVSLIRREQY
jgi:hypothetical protein